MAAVLLVLASALLVGCAASRSAPEAAASEADLAVGTNRAFAHTVTTTAAPEAVWALWTDVAGWPAWDVALDSAALDGPFAVGARGRLVPASGPASAFEIEAVDVGRSYTFATRLPLGALRVRRSWENAGPGQIAVTHAVSFHGLGGRMLAGRLGPQFRRALPGVMERLVALAEAER
ncbi:MAG: SRPBCC family protein [Bacteroidota bacterium]